jgi:hypothetical protein
VLALCDRQDIENDSLAEAVIYQWYLETSSTVMAAVINTLGAFSSFSVLS